MEQAKDILQQEPETEALPEGSETMQVNGYVAYLNLDWLEQVFLDYGFRDDPARQSQFIEETQQGLADVVLKRQGKPGVMMTYSWYDSEGRLRRAIEVMPVAAAAKGLQIVTPDVTGYQQLRDKLAEVERENFQLRQQIRQIGETLKAADIITDRAFRATFDRKPGGLVEKFEKRKTREQLEREREQVLHDLTYARECMKELTRNDHTREWMSKMVARQEERLKEIEEELEKLQNDNDYAEKGIDKH